MGSASRGGGQSHRPMMLIQPHSTSSMLTAASSTSAAALPSSDRSCSPVRPLGGLTSSVPSHRALPLPPQQQSSARALAQLLQQRHSYLSGTAAAITATTNRSGVSPDRGARINATYSARKNRGATVFACPSSLRQQQRDLLRPASSTRRASRHAAADEGSSRAQMHHGSVSHDIARGAVHAAAAAAADVLHATDSAPPHRQSDYPALARGVLHTAYAPTIAPAPVPTARASPSPPPAPRPLASSSSLSRGRTTAHTGGATAGRSGSGSAPRAAGALSSSPRRTSVADRRVPLALQAKGWMHSLRR